MNSRDLGIIQINRPQIHLKVRPDGSNLEDALQKLLADLSKTAQPSIEPQNSAGAPVAFAVQLVDGTILAEDIATGRVWRIDGVNVQYDCHGTNGGLGNGSLAGQISVAGPNGAAPVPAGRFAITLKPATAAGTNWRCKPMASRSPWPNRGSTVLRPAANLAARSPATAPPLGPPTPTPSPAT